MFSILWICNFKDFIWYDGYLVGGKNFLLGEMIREFGIEGIFVLFGFVIILDVYWCYIDENGIRDKVIVFINDWILEKVSFVEMGDLICLFFFKSKWLLVVEVVI